MANLGPVWRAAIVSSAVVAWVVEVLRILFGIGLDGIFTGGSSGGGGLSGGGQCGGGAGAVFV